MRWRGWIVAIALLGTVASTPVRASDGATIWTDAGWGVLTVLSNAVYMPVKFTYATLGALTGGMAYGLTLGDFETAETIWVTSMGGSYIITPRMLQGEDALSFSGSRTTDTSADTAAPSTPSRHSTLSEQNLGN